MFSSNAIILSAVLFDSVQTIVHHDFIFTATVAPDKIFCH